MEYYLMAALEALPGRHLAKGAVFNGADVIFYEARREDGEIVMYESEQLTLSTGAVEQPRLNQRLSSWLCMRARCPWDVAPVLVSGASWVWEHFWRFLLSGGGSGSSLDDWEQLAAHYGWNPPKLYAQSASGSGATLLQPKSLIANDDHVEVWEAERGSQQVRAEGCSPGSVHQQLLRLWPTAPAGGSALPRSVRA